MLTDLNDRRRKQGWFAAVALVLMASLIFAQRWHTFAEPMDRDIAGYAVIGHEMLKGRHLYSDLWERKPPLLMASFAAAERVSRYGPREIFLLNVAIATATLLALYAAGGLLAAAIWTVVCGDLSVLGNQPNAEAFVNLCLAIGFAALLRLSDSHRYRRALIVGVFFSAATLYKQHAVLMCAAIWAGELLSSATNKDWRNFRSKAIDACISASVMLLAWLIVLAFFSCVGRFGDFYSALFRQNAAYAGNLASNLVASFRIKNLFPPAMYWSVFPLGIMIWWMATGVTAAISPRSRALLIAYTISAWLVIALPGRFWAHYYQLLLPPLCIGGGWCAHAAVGSKSRLPAPWRWGMIMILFAIAACWESTFYAFDPDEWAHAKYATDDLPAEQSLGLQLNHLLKPDERFWEWGNDNILYFAAEKSPPTGLLYLEPIIVGPECEAYTARLLRDLQHSPPDLILIDQRWAAVMPINVAQWVQQNYTVYHGDLNQLTYRVLIRTGSDAARRLEHSQVRVDKADGEQARRLHGDT